MPIPEFIPYFFPPSYNLGLFMIQVQNHFRATQNGIPHGNLSREKAMEEKLSMPQTNLPPCNLGFAQDPTERNAFRILCGLLLAGSKGKRRQWRSHPGQKYRRKCNHDTTAPVLTLPSVLICTLLSLVICSWPKGNIVCSFILEISIQYSVF